jgi:hypothetical protein
MVVYVVCAEVPWDSYHSLILVTLAKTEAENTVNDFNAKHDPECRAYEPGGSDWDECFCKRYHLHSVPLKGLMPRIRSLIKAAQDLDLLSVLSGDSTI